MGVYKGGVHSRGVHKSWHRSTLINNRLFSKIAIGLIYSFTTLLVSCSGNSENNKVSGTEERSPGTADSLAYVANSIVIDSDGDGVINAYDFAYDNSNLVASGSGSEANPYMIRNIYQLQALAGFDHQGITLNKSLYTSNNWLYGESWEEQLSKSYALSNDLDASISTKWLRLPSGTTGNLLDASNQPLQDFYIGFIPIGSCGLGAGREKHLCESNTTQPFTGNFNGNSFLITGLVMSYPRKSGVALFSALAPGASITSIGLTLLNISAENGNEIGGLVANNQGRIDNSFVNGMVVGGNDVGGLMGVNLGEVINSYASGMVSGAEGVGGLVGANFQEIIGSYAANYVVASDKTGGLVGVNYKDASITSSYAVGQVAASTQVGGLVGENRGSILSSYGSAEVMASQEVGGLAGNSKGSITASYSTGNVEGELSIGGLVGSAKGYVARSFSRGNVTGAENVGGLIGLYNSRQDIHATYSVGEVKVRKRSNARGRGKPIRIETTGGLVGRSIHVISSTSYWDKRTSKRNYSAALPFRRGLFSKQLKGCGLNGKRLRGSAKSLDCADVFPASSWEHVAVEGGNVVGWDIENAEDYPQLLAHDANGSNILPTAACVGERRTGNLSILAENRSYSSESLFRGECSTALYLSQGVVGTDVGRIIVAYNQFSRFSSYQPFSYLMTSQSVNQFGERSNNDLFVIDERSGLISMARDANVYDIGTHNLEIRAILDGEASYDFKFLVVVRPGIPRYLFYYLDSDGDGEINLLDSDEDGDGIIDSADACNIDRLNVAVNWNSNELSDEDGDGCRDFDEDEDDDGNGLIEIGTANELEQIHNDFEDVGSDNSVSNLVNVLSGRRGCGATTAINDVNTDAINTSACQGYELVANISLDGYDWQPIGSCVDGAICSKSFNLIFEGNGWTISNLTIANLDWDYEERPDYAESYGIGLFASARPPAVFRNINFDGGSISSYGHGVGLLAGYAFGNYTSGVTMINVSASNSKILGFQNVGSLIGYSNYLVVESSYADNILVGGESYLGGILGDGKNGKIMRSFASNVSMKGSIVMGGLAGSAKYSNIILSYAEGNSIAGDYAVGGLVGDVRFSNITSSYVVNSSLKVAGGAVGGAVGGLAAWGEGAYVSSFYAAVTMINGNGDRNDVGGLIAKFDDFNPLTNDVNNIIFINSYWDNTTIGIATRFEANPTGDGEAKATYELQGQTDFAGIYAAWGNIWCDANSGDYTTDSNSPLAIPANRAWKLGSATQYPTLNCTPDFP